MWNCSNYGNDLNITLADAQSGSHQGDCYEDVKALMETSYIKRQMKKLKPEVLVKDLKDAGAWDDEQLKDHEENLIRWLWMSCCDISERRS